MAHALTEGREPYQGWAVDSAQLRPTQPSLGMVHALADAGAFAAGEGSATGDGAARPQATVCIARWTLGIDSDHCTSAQDCRSQLAHVPSRLPNWLLEPLAVSGRPARRYGLSRDLPCRYEPCPPLRLGLRRGETVNG